MTAISDNGTRTTRFRVPVVLRAVVTGLLVGLVGANVWPLLVLKVGMPIAAAAEAVFLALYFWWASGGGFPAALSEARRAAFGPRTLSNAQWLWAIACALAFAVTAHAGMVVLFRLVPYPVELFHRDYNAMSLASFSMPLQWLVIVVSAASAGICEETGFRGYLQRPIAGRHGAVAAILISSVLFTVVHFSKSWAIPEMVPLMFVLGALLGIIAWASDSLIPGMIAHTVMDIGLFAYWWTGTAGIFTAKTISVTGVDASFEIACGTLGAAFLVTLFAAAKLRGLARARLAAA